MSNPSIGPAGLPDHADLLELAGAGIGAARCTGDGKAAVTAAIRMLL